MNADNLNKQHIQLHCNDFFDIHIKDIIDSTNDALKRNMNHIQQGFTLIANQQTQGKGRNDHTFHSPENHGIYLSLFLKPKLTIESSLKMMMVTSVALVNTIQKIYNINASIKWINDIYIQDKKVCGILIENAIQSNNTTLDSMIIGIGINLHRYNKPSDIASIAASVEDFSNHICSRNLFISTLLNEFYHLYLNIDDTEILNAYKNYSNVLGKEILVKEPLQSYIAKAIDINENGHLIVEVNQKRFPLISGEIHVRTLPF